MRTPTRIDDWDDEVARRRTTTLGGNVVLRVQTPQQVVRLPVGSTEPSAETLMPLAQTPDDSTVIGVAYRCESSRI
jgi:hypothetical protein